METANQLINTENWGHARLTTSKLQAFISLGGEPTDDEVQFTYNVVVADLDYKEIHGQKFTQLESAMAFINQKYGHFKLVNSLTAQKSGCSDCSA
jgi:hypothetical protein